VSALVAREVSTYDTHETHLRMFRVGLQCGAFTTEFTVINAQH